MPLQPPQFTAQRPQVIYPQTVQQQRQGFWGAFLGAIPSIASAAKDVKGLMFGDPNEEYLAALAQSNKVNSWLGYQEYRAKTQPGSEERRKLDEAAATQFPEWRDSIAKLPDMIDPADLARARMWEEQRGLYESTDQIRGLEPAAVPQEMPQETPQEASVVPGAEKPPVFGEIPPAAPGSAAEQDLPIPRDVSAQVAAEVKQDPTYDQGEPLIYQPQEVVSPPEPRKIDIRAQAAKQIDVSPDAVVLGPDGKPYLDPAVGVERPDLRAKGPQMSLPMPVLSPEETKRVNQTVQLVGPKVNRLYQRQLQHAAGLRVAMDLREGRTPQAVDMLQMAVDQGEADQIRKEAMYGLGAIDPADMDMGITTMLYVMNQDPEKYAENAEEFRPYWEQFIRLPKSTQAYHWGMAKQWHDNKVTADAAIRAHQERMATFEVQKINAQAGLSRAQTAAEKAPSEIKKNWAEAAKALWEIDKGDEDRALKWRRLAVDEQTNYVKLLDNAQVFRDKSAKNATALAMGYATQVETTYREIDRADEILRDADKILSPIGVLLDNVLVGGGELPPEYADNPTYKRALERARMAAQHKERLRVRLWGVEDDPNTPENEYVPGLVGQLDRANAEAAVAISRTQNPQQVIDDLGKFLVYDPGYRGGFDDTRKAAARRVVNDLRKNIGLDYSVSGAAGSAGGGGGTAESPGDRSDTYVRKVDRIPPGAAPTPATATAPAKPVDSSGISKQDRLKVVSTMNRFMSQFPGVTDRETIKRALTSKHPGVFTDAEAEQVVTAYLRHREQTLGKGRSK